MALFPQGLTQIAQRCNAGERRVLHQLKRCLEDDYLVWHDIPIGPKARQPDFVILSPRWGVLLLEVKDWRPHTLGPATRDSVELRTPRGPATVAHPLRQARDYALELVDLMKADPALVHPDGPFAGRLLFPYGYGVVMASLRAAEVAGSDFGELFPPARTLLRDDLDEALAPMDFQHRLWGLFTVSYPYTLSLPQRDRVRWHLFPELRVQPQAALDFEGPEPAAPPLPDLMQVMDLQQEQVARTLGEGHRVIHGAAGSGKTMILIYRAQVLAQAARADRPILVLCFNRALADRITHQLRQRGVDERVQVRTFHAWCQDLCDTYQLDVPRGLKGDAHFVALAATVERAVERGRVPAGQYLALLIDEAHDFQDAWLRIASRMVDPQSNSLLVLYDDAQSIYQGKRRRFNFASVGVQAQGRTSILRLNYRNTAEVLALALLCAQDLMTQPTGAAEDDMPVAQPASAGRRGALPVLIEARHAQQEAELLAERLAAAHAAGTPLDEMAVLCRTRAQMWPIERALAARGLPLQSMNSPGFRRFDWRTGAIKLVTLHSAKGLEFSLVCVAGLHLLPLRDESLEDALRLLYVAMTRATRELVLSAHGSGPLVERVRQALGVVARQFAAAG
ncbi:MAG TPA: NERD domain-containing protein/DEAD/DEAH box helicase [Rubrivivax sp.]|nr:NERD domain-containing protein/DEAD/DEAH box helicase [Rubrivivax sp.]